MPPLLEGSNFLSNWSCSMSKWFKQAHPLQENDCQGQIDSGRRNIRNKDLSCMAFWFLNTHCDPPQTQTHQVVVGNPIVGTNAQNNKENAGIKDWAHGPPWLCNPLGLSLPQLPQIPTRPFSEQEDDNNWQQNHKQLSADAINFGQSAEKNWHEFTRVLVTPLKILLWFMPRWLGRLQQSRTCMEIQSPRGSAIASNKQLTQIFGHSDNALDWHH